MKIISVRRLTTIRENGLTGGNGMHNRKTIVNLLWAEGSKGPAFVPHSLGYASRSKAFSFKTRSDVAAVAYNSWITDLLDNRLRDTAALFLTAMISRVFVILMLRSIAVKSVLTTQMGSGHCLQKNAAPIL